MMMIEMKLIKKLLSIFPNFLAVQHSKKCSNGGLTVD